VEGHHVVCFFSRFWFFSWLVVRVQKHAAEGRLGSLVDVRLLGRVLLAPLKTRWLEESCACRSSFGGRLLAEGRSSNANEHRPKGQSPREDKGADARYIGPTHSRRRSFFFLGSRPSPGSPTIASEAPPPRTGVFVTLKRLEKGLPLGAGRFCSAWGRWPGYAPRAMLKRRHFLATARRSFRAGFGGGARPTAADYRPGPGTAASTPGRGQCRGQRAGRREESGQGVVEFAAWSKLYGPGRIGLERRRLRLRFVAGDGVPRGATGSGKSTIMRLLIKGARRPSKGRASRRRVRDLAEIRAQGKCIYYRRNVGGAVGLPGLKVDADPHSVRTKLAYAFSERAP